MTTAPVTTSPHTDHSPEDAARRIADKVIAQLLTTPQGMLLSEGTVTMYRNRLYIRALHSLQALCAPPSVAGREV